MSIIRKISVGKDYPDGVMHFQVGKRAARIYEISEIILNEKLLEIGKLSYDVYIQNEDGKVLWKSITDVPVTIEYMIDFE
tara:strand:- start:25 stop:264 length:240 start_codon:yes stop_codon:yes gene_type:complete